MSILSSLRLACKGRYGHVLTNALREELEREIMTERIPGMEDDRKNTRRDGVTVRRDLRIAMKTYMKEHQEVYSENEQESPAPQAQ